mgnify:CR=1 FL=1
MSDKADCVFCKVIAGEVPSSMVYQDGEFVAFADINPKAPVHVLVVPKVHIESVNELDNEALAGKWLLTAKTVAHKVGVGQAYRLKMYVGAGAGQTVAHLHMHILGGWKTPQSEE